jgi:hypothetical protein
LATERTDGLRADGESAAAALNSGYHLAYLIGAGLVLVAIAVAVSVLRSQVPEAAAVPVTRCPPSPSRPHAFEPSPWRAMRSRAAAASRPGCES